MGLKSAGSQKDFEAIRNNWLPKKNVNEIKHRIKNLTCRRAPNNVIKQWKFEHQIPLRHDTTEFLHLAQAIKWFGTGGHQQLSQEDVTQKLSSDQSPALRQLVKNSEIFERVKVLSQFQRWNQISRYFLPSRQGDFLKLEYQNIAATPDKAKKLSEQILSHGSFLNSKEQGLDSQLKSLYEHKQQQPIAKEKQINIIDIVESQPDVAEVEQSSISSYHSS